MKLEHKQKLLLSGILVGGVVIGMGITSFLFQSPTSHQESSASTFELPSKALSNPDLWRHKLESEQVGLTKKIDVLVDAMKKREEEEQRQQSLWEEKFQQLETERLKEQVQPILAEGTNSGVSDNTQLGFGQNVSKVQANMPFSEPASLNMLSAGLPTAGVPTAGSRIQHISLSLNPDTSFTTAGAVETTIPAGTFAQAVLLGGVDAATSVNASSDPKPVLLKILDRGILPREFKSPMKACHMTAAAYGDLSSERVYMRLEKLTCVEKDTGEIMEMDISGYVAGEDGRAGVRGVLVDRAGEQVRSAMVSGFFGGMSDFASSSLHSGGTSVTPFGVVNQLEPLDKKQIVKSAAGQGVASAFNRLADYFIKRAEQIQPVIQVAAGRRVDIVFTQGVDFSKTQALHVRHHRHEVQSDSVLTTQQEGHS